MLTKEKKGNINTVLKLTMLTIMIIQIVLSIVWIVQNYTTIPIFGDTAEYLEISQTLQMDEYRPILYPLILRWCTQLSNLIHMPYQVLIYTLQFVLSLISLFYTIRIIQKEILDIPNSRRMIIRGLITATYLCSIPMITFMNFTVLTDSLATSILVIILAECGLLLLKSNTSLKHTVILIVLLIIESLLRSDRMYSCITLIAVIYIVRFIKYSKMRKSTLLAFLSVSVIVTATVTTVNKHTQTPGLHGRIQTNLEFVLLDRVVWPNMVNCYEYFPNNIKEIITIEDATTFDSHNNNVMYQMAPLIEGTVGREKAKEMYLTMAKIVLKHQGGKVLIDTTEDILTMFFTPFSSLLHHYNLCDKNDSWNIHCMSTATPNLTNIYNLYFHFSFLFLFMINFLYWLIYKIKRTPPNKCVTFTPYVIMSIILTLWFCIGDGAPPNSRYALIIYVAWGVWVTLLSKIWKGSSFN